MNLRAKRGYISHFSGKGDNTCYGVEVKQLVKKFIPCFLLDFYHYSLVLIGAFFYGFPSRKMMVIGVTGTSGKSTVVELAAKILEETGCKVASLSSIKFKIGEREWENKLKMTMPGRMQLQKFLKQANKANCKYVVLEITSEGIKQYRHKFINFDVAVFTNLSPEHIESHKGFENYRKAKLKLFKNTKKIHIVNLDDKNAEYFLEIPAAKKIGFRIKNQESRIKDIKIIEAKEIKLKENYSSFVINNSLFRIFLLGEFNVYNALAAICVGLSQGISLEDCKTALEKVKAIPGRMEIVIREPFTVIVDYAHTPDSLRKVYETLLSLKSKIKNSRRSRVPTKSRILDGKAIGRSLIAKPSGQKSKMICVLGSCGGGRDKWKRPVLGKLAAKYCEEIIITNEDPYDENPMEIIEKVIEGTKGKADKILDRRKAIREALKRAKNNDVVIITGKGSEPWMCVEKGKKIAWDDRKIVREEFQRVLD